MLVQNFVFIILFAHILQESNSAADFLPRMQSHPNLTSQIELMDHVPRREKKIETEAEALNLFLSRISENAPFFEDIQPVADEQFVNQLEAQGLYDQFSVKEPCDDPDVFLTGFFSLSSIRQVNLIQATDFEDVCNNLPNSTQPLVLVQGQKTMKLSER